MADQHIMPTATSSFATEDLARQEIIDTLRKLDSHGLNIGRAGNMSMAWSRGGRAGFLISPSALPYDQLEVDDLVWTPLDQSRQGAGQTDVQAAPPREHAPMEQYGRRSASSEWRMHLALLSRREAQACVLHVHAPYASTLACMPRVQAHGIPAFHYMIATAGGNDIRCAPYETFGSVALAEALIPAMNERRACLLANHGLIACAESPSAVLELTSEVEWLSRLYWQALQVGEPSVLSDQQMAAVHERFAASAYRA